MAPETPAAEPSPAYAPGELIARRYRVLRHFRGGIAEVFQCRDERTGVLLAIKTPQDPPEMKPQRRLRRQRRFRAESAIWATLEDHPNVVRCHYLALDGERPLLCMEWIEGGDPSGPGLGRLLRSRASLPAGEALGLAIGACRGLLHLQSHHPGFVHRDLKPENLLVGLDGTPKVTDFGFSLLRGLELWPAAAAVSDSSIVGTPPYMAPEQWRSGLVDDRADVYAMGLILFEMLEGRRPFSAHERSEWRRAHCEQAPPAAESAPPVLRELVARCLAKDRDERPASIAALMERLVAVYFEVTGTEIPPLPSAAEASALVLSNRGNSFYHLGLFEDALRSYAEAMEIEPTLGQALAGSALALQALGRPEEALAAYETALSYEHARASTYANHAVLLRSLGRSEEATAGFTRALDLDPSLAEAAFNRGLLHLEAGNAAAAEQDFGSAIESSGLPAALIARAKLVARSGDFVRALADIERAATGGPLTADDEERRAEWLLEVKRWRDAVAAYTVLLSRGLPAVPLHRSRAGAYLRAGRPADSIEDLTTALRLDPLDPETFLQRGSVYRDLGRWDDALADFSQAILLNDSDARGYFAAGLVLGYRGETEAARALLEASKERGSGDAARAIRSLDARLRAVKALAGSARRPR